MKSDSWHEMCKLKKDFFFSLKQRRLNDMNIKMIYLREICKNIYQIFEMNLIDDKIDEIDI